MDLISQLQPPNYEYGSWGGGREKVVYLLIPANLVLRKLKLQVQGQGLILILQCWLMFTFN